MSTACTWRENEDGQWETACGRVWEFNDGGPADNHCRFCFYCGLAVRAVACDDRA